MSRTGAKILGVATGVAVAGILIGFYIAGYLVGNTPAFRPTVQGSSASPTVHLTIETVR